MEQVSFELIRRVRLHIERTEKQVKLLEKQKEWLKLTAALDVLEDSSCAIEYYSDSEYPDDICGKYLFSYGLLQALFLQQDAINGISEALFGNSINYKDQYPTAYAVREIRNDVVGHPTNRSGKQYIYLVQSSLEKESFDYIKQEPDREEVESIAVDVFAAISDTGKAMNTILNNSLYELDTEFKNYIDAHKERKMKDIFNHLSYAREKVLLNTDMKSWGYETTKTMVAKCEEELIQRYGSISATDSYQYLLNDIHKTYDLIDTGLPRVPRDLFSDFENCLLENLFNKLKELKSYCTETDEYFENYGEIPVTENDVTPIIIDDISQLTE